MSLCTNIRYPEHFDVKHANTGRLQTSAIPYMQILLNDDSEKNPEKKSKKKANTNNLIQLFIGDFLFVILTPSSIFHIDFRIFPI